MKKSILAMCLAFALPLLAESNVLVFAGSTRADSCNKKLAKEAASIANEIGAKVVLIDLKDYPIPFYDADLEKNEGMPKKAKQLRDLMINSDAILIASPEYNGSIPGLLKNTLDWASRNEQAEYSNAAFQGKKFGIMSASPGKFGGIRGLDHLRTIIENLGGIVVTNQVAVPNAYNAFNENGVLENKVLRQELKKEVAKVVESQK